MGAMTPGKNRDRALFNVAKSVKRLEEKNNKSNPTLSEDLPKEPLSKEVPKEPPPSYAAEDKALFAVVSSFKRIGEKEDLLSEDRSGVVSEIKEEVLSNIKILEEKEDVLDEPQEPQSPDNSDLLDKLINIVIDFKEEIDNDIRQTQQNLGADIAIVEQRQNLHKETYKIDVVSQIKEEVLEEVLSDVQRILSGDVANNIKRLEEKIDIIRDGYKQTLTNVENSDPLTPLDQNFVTLEQLNDHYKLFLNRVQTQLATLGGGGSIELQYLEDVNVGIATNITAYDGYYLQVDLNQTGNDANKKFKFAPLSVAGVTTFSSTVTFDGPIDANSNIDVAGVSTFNDDVKFNGNTSGMLWDHSTNDLILYNDTRLEFGSNKDFEIWHGGSHTFMKNTGGDLRIRGDVIKLAREDSTETYIECNVNSSVDLYFNGNQKFATTLEGVSVTGLTTTTHLAVSGVTTHFGDVIVSDDLLVTQRIRHVGDTDTYIDFSDDQIELYAGGKGILTVTEDSVDSVVINDGSNNCDFRVEGLNDEYLIFSDGGTDSVGIGTSVPTTKFDISGSLNASGLSTFRNGLNVLGLLHTNDNVNFTGDAYNLSWDKSDNALEFTDNAKATFGAGNDLEIHSNGTTGVVGGAVSFTSDITVGTSQAVGVVLTSPNGTKYRLVVADDGTLSTSAV